MVRKLSCGSCMSFQKQVRVIIKEDGLNILLIQIMRLGDALQMVPTIRGLKELFPDSRISVLASSLGSQIFSIQPEVDHVFVLRKEVLASLVKNSKMVDLMEAVDVLESDLKDVISRKWDWVINFSYSFPSAILAFLADGPHSSGFHTTNKRIYFLKEKWLAYCVSAFVNRKYSVFNWVDINKNVINLPSVTVGVDFLVKKDELKKAEIHLGELGFSGKKILGFSPGASGDYKKWPIEKFVKLGRSLVKEHDYKLLIFGDKGDMGLGCRLREEIGPGCEDLTGKTTIPQLTAYLSKCDLVVSNDTGTAHVSSAVGTPVITLFFSTHFVETGPYDAGHIVVFPDISCFPCKETAKCSHKKCLKYIDPDTIERVVRDYDALMKQGKTFVLAEDEGPVAVNVSAFDPWGNLEWLPLDTRPMKPDDVIRLIYKIFWVSVLKEYKDLENVLPGYINSVVSRSGQIDQILDIKDIIFQFDKKLNNIKGLYYESYETCVKIYDSISSGDSDGVKKLSEELQKKEGEISAFGENVYLNPLVEYVIIRRDNIYEPDILKLGIKTASLYQDAHNMATKLKRCTEKVSGLLP